MINEARNNIQGGRDNGVPAGDALECAYARRTEIRPPTGWRRPPGRPRKTWLHQIGDGSKHPPSMGPCSRRRTFPTNEIGATGLRAQRSDDVDAKK